MAAEAQRAPSVRDQSNFAQSYSPKYTVSDPLSANEELVEARAIFNAISDALRSSHKVAAA